MSFAAECRTTAMGIMPHRDVERALKLVLTLDIPFWPQLPHVSLYEDMYVQSSENFPGIAIDFEKGRLTFNTANFEEQLNEYFTKTESPETYALTPKYAMVFQKFLSQNLQGYKAIRGQITGPVSFGFKVLDENLKPIIYNEEVKAILFDFIQKKVNVQYQELKTKNQNAFVWVDEPGLGYVFSGLSGYNDQQAKEDYYQFVQGIEGPKGLHLCAEVNLPYLLELGVEILSFDAFQIGFMPKEYTQSVKDFIQKGGIISWGIVPTELKALEAQTPDTLAALLSGYWTIISENTDLPLDQLAAQALIAPARCCLVELTLDAAERSKSSNIEEKIVEKAFSYLPEISGILKKRYGLE
jgi:hypothetical protein